jgi:hypothetical protein
MSNEEFCDLWNASESAEAVAAITGQSKQGATVKASKLRKLGLSLKAMPCHKIKPIEERFWAMVVKSPLPDGCWEFQGMPNDKGYGQISTTRKEGPVLAHRFSYKLHFGDLPDDRCVCHQCDNPPCVRPDHLFLGSRDDNMDDMQSKGRGWWQDGRPRTQHKTVSLGGRLVTLRQAAAQVGIPAEVIRQRLGDGWSEARALSEPVNAMKAAAAKSRRSPA